jgi:hypothetical protein
MTLAKVRTQMDLQESAAASVPYNQVLVTAVVQEVLGMVLALALAEKAEKAEKAEVVEKGSCNDKCSCIVHYGNLHT